MRGDAEDRRGRGPASGAGGHGGGGPCLRRRWGEGGTQVLIDAPEACLEGGVGDTQGREAWAPLWQPVQPANVVILRAVTWRYLPALTSSSRAQTKLEGQGGFWPAPTSPGLQRFVTLSVVRALNTFPLR